MITTNIISTTDQYYHREFVAMHEPHVDTWFDSLRSGDTGQGFTWEFRIADKVEDNLAKADIHDTEAKTTSSLNPKARVRMFTQNFGTEPVLYNQCSHITKGGTRRLARQIRTTSKEAKWNGHLTNLCFSSNMLQLTAGKLVSVIHRSNLDVILDDKIKNLAIINTQKRISPNDPLGKKMQYRYPGFVYYGGIIKERFYEYLEQGKIAVEFRLKGETVDKLDKDNGTSFNISKHLIPDLYRFHYQWDAIDGGRQLN